MKNIHVLPTDKPSRLYLSKEGFYFLLPNIKGNDVKFQHMYITSSEEIKEKWHINNVEGVNKPVYVKNEDVIPLKKVYGNNVTYLEKIILTTDQDLIKDGVQAIQDDFLEWFIKNPSCESVEVDKNWNYPLDKRWEYKIIIPQEEPKALTKLEIAKNIAAIGIGKEKPKQETLEEAAKIHLGIPIDRVIDEEERYYTADIGKYDSFIEGAKWQAKRMYSEEKVLELLPKFAAYTLINADEETRLPLKEWFEQFKKK
jgi:hypothetical protein